MFCTKHYKLERCAGWVHGCKEDDEHIVRTAKGAVHMCGRGNAHGFEGDCDGRKRVITEMLGKHNQIVDPRERSFLPHETSFQQLRITVSIFSKPDYVI